jgi:hypothetical protein
MPAGDHLALGAIDDEPARGIAADEGFELLDGERPIGFQFLKSDACHVVGTTSLRQQDVAEAGNLPVNLVTKT